MKTQFRLKKDGNIYILENEKWFEFGACHLKQILDDTVGVKLGYYWQDEDNGDNANFYVTYGIHHFNDNNCIDIDYYSSNFKNLIEFERIVKELIASVKYWYDNLPVDEMEIDFSITEMEEITN